MWFDLLMSLESLATCDTKWFHAPSLQLRSCSAATALTACALLIVIQKQPYVIFSIAAAQQSPSPRLSFFHREIQQWQFHSWL